MNPICPVCNTEIIDVLCDHIVGAYKVRYWNIKDHPWLHMAMTVYNMEGSQRMLMLSKHILLDEARIKKLLILK